MADVTNKQSKIHNNQNSASGERGIWEEMPLGQNILEAHFPSFGTGNEKRKQKMATKQKRDAQQQTKSRQKH